MALTFPTAVLRATAWRLRAACRPGTGIDPEIFFPAGEPGNRYDGRNRAALDVCARCPVQTECLAEALERIPYGIAGGMTARERARLRARRRPAVEAEGGGPAPRTSAPDPALPRAVTRARGIELLLAGRRREDIARTLDVAQRTVDRWAVLPEVRPHMPERVIIGGISRREAARMGARRVS